MNFIYITYTNVTFLDVNSNILYPLNIPVSQKLSYFKLLPHSDMLKNQPCHNTDDRKYNFVYFNV